MAFLTWTDSMSVKIESIDKQHQKLIGMISDFYENIKTRSNNDNILKLVDGMKKYTLEHFRYEEKFMQQFNYPGYVEHKHEHDLFVTKVNALEEKYKSGKIIVSYEITSFLKDWITNQIQGVDKKYSDFLVKNGVE